jgi:hypothetical protein
MGGTYLACTTAIAKNTQTIMDFAHMKQNMLMRPKQNLNSFIGFVLVLLHMLVLLNTNTHQ